MATSRRSRAVTGRPSGRKAEPQAETALEPNQVPEIDPNEPEAPAEAEAETEAEAEAEAVGEELEAGAASSGSSRRNLVRQSSRRMQVASSAGTPGYKKSARILTPAEIAARKQAVRGGIWLFVIILLIIGGAFAAWQLFLRENPLEKKAVAQLSEGAGKLKVVEQAINNRQAAPARLAYAAGIKALQVPELGNAKEPIDPKDPNLASLTLAQKAVELNKQLHATEERIDKVERDSKVDQNRRALSEALGHLADLDKVQLTALEKRIPLFVANPVEPDAGTPNDYQGAYKDIVNDMKNQQPLVDQENSRRLASITSEQEKKALSEIEVLVKTELFNEALLKLDDYKGKFEQGNFESLREFVKNSAQQSWAQAKAYAESRYTDYKSPGIPEPLAKQALADARARLEQVVSKFGIDDYVNQAKELLSKYPAQ
jgi:hypothetical protein